MLHELSFPTSPHDVSMVHELDASILLADADLLCGYASKRCINVRTTKKGGGLHRFCEFHRRRANQNQWRVDNKRRAVRAQRRQQLKRARASAMVPEPLSKPQQILTLDDITLLQAMLFDDDELNRNRHGAISFDCVSLARLDCTAVEFVL